MNISAISCLIHDRFGRCPRERSSILDIGRIADSTIFLQEAFCKTSNFGWQNPSYVRQRAEWAFMNETDPEQRSEARDGALARLRPAHCRLLRRGRGPVQRADSPARVSSHAPPLRPR